MISRLLRKATAALISGAMIFALASCAVSGEKDQGTFKVIATIFPEYDWVRQIAGSELTGNKTIDLELLIDNGVDTHSFQPTVNDIMAISECDMFIYIGGESDDWVEDALSNATNKDMIAVNIMDLLDESSLEVEDLETEEHEEDHDEEEGPEYDEHVWLSIRRAMIAVDGIKDALVKMDPDHASIYESNAASYKDSLSELDGRYAETVDNAQLNTLVFGDRFPFRYMCKDYGIEYYAAFEGCEAETEASFNTMITLAEKADETGVPAIMTIDGSDGSIAQTIIDNTESKDQQILTLDSMQSVTAQRIEQGETYLSIMESDLEVLRVALEG